MTTIVMVHADSEFEWNCSEWRIVTPAYGLQRIGVTVDMMNLDEWRKTTTDAGLMKRVDKADVVVLQRNAFAEALAVLKHWRKLDKPVYIDLDDAYQILPQSNTAFRFWHENVNKLNPPPLDQLRDGLATSNGLTSPSKLILEDWTAPKKVWLPNYVRAEWYQQLERRPHDGLIIGWGGSMSHRDSFRYSGAVEGLARVCEKYPFVRVAICGNDTGNVDMVRHIAPQQRFWMPGVPPNEWPQILSQFDIGIAPLWAEYDRRRSWLKVVEYACAGVPCIVTKSDPYAELTDWSVQIDNGPDEWETALSEMIENIHMHQALAMVRRVKAVLAFSIESNAGKWLDGLL